jgi:chromate reductase
MPSHWDQLKKHELNSDRGKHGRIQRATGTALAQQHLRNVLAYLDVPTLGQPEAFLQVREGLFDEAGNIGDASCKFLQNWMNRYFAW